MKDLIVKISERGVGIFSYIFPFIEVSYYFGSKVFLSTDSIALKYFYVRYIDKLANLYATNTYLIFALMVGIFLICSRGTLPLTKFVRFNVIQAILVNIICSCIGSIFSFLPIIFRESIIGILFANFIYLGIMGLILYASFMIFFGRYPKIPVLSEAAKLQVQRGYSN
jgi:uncharacterized membrane protein